jgi:dipeptidyl aminopeptidase/acylaminoacyl peptidase
MGGADTYDFLSGIDALIERGVADPKRLAVMGHSYGGYMAAWLISQDSRFAAAVTSSPITNYVTEHLLSNIPHWPALFLAESYNLAGGKYFERSPIMHAYKVKTPTLNICGRLDRSAPPEEAAQFHNALLQHGGTSLLVTYPREGHGVRSMPALIDYAARIVSWFDQYC